MNELIHLPEPKLEFQFQQCTEDCRDGLTLFGPYNQSSGKIRVGVIGTGHGVRYYTDFVRLLNMPIYTNSLGRPFYPGFQSVFNLEWSETPSAILELEQKKIDALLKVRNLKERTYKLVSLYLEKIDVFLRNDEQVIDIWFVIIPHDIWLLCRPMSQTGRPTFSTKQVDIFLSGQMSFFSEENDEVSKYVEMYESDSDFHDQLKARALANKVTAPIQIILEDTLLFKSKITGEPYSDEMKASIAWTQSSSLYYKLGYLPWKLSGVREGVCYIGIVFKRLNQSRKGKNYACSAAQMFLDSGDGIIFRGNNGPWLSRDERTFHLNRQSAYELIKLAVDTYKEHRGEFPKELFIHGRTRFSDDEWDGFCDAVKDSQETQIVGVTINSSDGLRLFRNTPDTKCKYGILRGICLIVDNASGYLWTKGFIPKTETSNHMEVACPLRVSISRGDAEIKVVLSDIMALTKLNYNACIYGDGLPVTLRFSDKIGDILTAIPEVNWNAKQFKYYI